MIAIVIVIVMMTMMMMMLIDDDDDDSDSDDSDDTRVSNGTPKQGHRSALRPRLLRSERRRPAPGSVDKRTVESQIVMSF